MGDIGSLRLEYLGKWFLPPHLTWDQAVQQGHVTGQYVVVPMGQAPVKFYCSEGGVWAICDSRQRTVDFGALRNTVTEHNITYGAQCQGQKLLRCDKFKGGATMGYCNFSN